MEASLVTFTAMAAHATLTYATAGLVLELVKSSLYLLEAIGMLDEKPPCKGEADQKTKPTDAGEDGDDDDNEDGYGDEGEENVSSGDDGGTYQKNTNNGNVRKRPAPEAGGQENGEEEDEDDEPEEPEDDDDDDEDDDEDEDEDEDDEEGVEEGLEDQEDEDEDDDDDEEAAIQLPKKRKK